MKRDIAEIEAFLRREIVPRYEAFDAGHRSRHVLDVMSEAVRLTEFYPDADKAITLVAAAYHDLGLASGREMHHVHSAEIVRVDDRLRQWFTDDEINLIADAAEDHRASSKHAPRTIYGRIVAEADRQIVPETVVRRTIQYGLRNEPQLNREGQFQRTRQHLIEKYGEGGYLRIWIPESDNSARLEQLRSTLKHPEELRQIFDKLYNQLTSQSTDLS